MNTIDAPTLKSHSSTPHKNLDKSDPLFTAQKPALAVDVVLFTIVENDLKVGLIQRQEEPYFGKYALPGRFVRYEEPIETTAKIALQQKANIEPESVFLEQLYTFGQDLHRDTRLRVITIVYYGLVRAENIGGSKISWHSFYKLPQTAFDHANIIDCAVQRLRRKVLEGDFAFQLMPEAFTLTELQKAYEVILHKELDKRNFRKKIQELHILKDLKKTKMEFAHRPARLYAFLRKK